MHIHALQKRHAYFQDTVIDLWSGSLYISQTEKAVFRSSCCCCQAAYCFSLPEIIKKILIQSVFWTYVYM